jgi:hypothetical protein
VIREEVDPTAIAISIEALLRRDEPPTPLEQPCRCLRQGSVVGVPKPRKLRTAITRVPAESDLKNV